PDPPAEYASDVEKNDPHRGCLRLARLRILCVHYGVYTNANFASAHEIRDPRVGDLLRFCDCTERKEQTRAECRANDPSHFHDGLLSMRRVSKTPFRQLPKNLTRAPSPDQSEGLTHQHVPLSKIFCPLFAGDKLHIRVAGCPLLAQSGHALVRRTCLP